MACTRRAALAVLAAGFAASTAEGAPQPEMASPPEPRRIVSTNPCLDAILVQVVDRSRIAALSRYSRDPSTSSIGALGKTFPFTYGGAEEIVALRPDLVLAAGLSGPAIRAALKRLAIRVETFGVPNAVAQSENQVTRIAALVRRPEQGAALVAAIEAALARAAPPPGERPLSALVFEAGGLVSAPHTLVDELLTRCGFVNVAARYGVTRTADVPLELLLADPPDILLAGRPEPGAPAWADRLLTHPALAQVGRRMLRAAFPQRLIFCGGPTIIEAAGTLAAIRRRAREAHA
jgi:iron complex transport system substrate-binding protein